MKTATLLPKAGPILLAALRQRLSIKDATAAASLSSSTPYIWLSAAQNRKDASTELVDFNFDFFDALAEGMRARCDIVVSPVVRSIENESDDVIIEETTINYMSIGMLLLTHLDYQMDPVDFDELRDNKIEGLIVPQEEEQRNASDYYYEQKELRGSIKVCSPVLFEYLRKGHTYHRSCIASSLNKSDFVKELSKGGEFFEDCCKAASIGLVQAYDMVDKPKVKISTNLTTGETIKTITDYPSKRSIFLLERAERQDRDPGSEAEVNPLETLMFGHLSSSEKAFYLR